MRNIHLFFVILIALAAGACSTGTNLTKTNDLARAAYETGDYQAALGYYETIINDYKTQGKENECRVYFEAADAAGQLGMTEKSISYLEQNRYTPMVNGDTYFELAKKYREVDNLSKEMDALDTYLDKYPDGDKTSLVHERLFKIYVEIEEWEKVLEEWNQIPEEKQEEASFTDDYFIANKALKNDTVCDALATQMLINDPNNLLALDWMGKKYFWQAENRYQDELKAYDKNKTNKQYNKLLKALDIVSAEFKKSLGYFTTLYELDPTPKTAKYLSNIYNRLDDKKKSEYYEQLAE
jgi:tetratricopeptide (TPR) repeat protein